MTFKYQGCLIVWEVKTIFHKTIHVHAFTEEDALERAKEWIRETPLFESRGEVCFDNIQASRVADYPFMLI